MIGKLKEKWVNFSVSVLVLQQKYETLLGEARTLEKQLDQTRGAVAGVQECIVDIKGEGVLKELDEALKERIKELNNSSGNPSLGVVKEEVEEEDNDDAVVVESVEVEKVEL